MKHLTNKDVLSPVRSFIYKMGFLPKPESILYSPSLHWFHILKRNDPPRLYLDDLMDP